MLSARPDKYLKGGEGLRGPRAGLEDGISPSAVVSSHKEFIRTPKDLRIPVGQFYHIYSKFLRSPRVRTMNLPFPNIRDGSEWDNTLPSFQPPNYYKGDKESVDSPEDSKK